MKELRELHKQCFNNRELPNFLKELPNGQMPVANWPLIDGHQLRRRALAELMGRRPALRVVHDVKADLVDARGGDWGPGRPRARPAQYIHDQTGNPHTGYVLRGPKGTRIKSINRSSRWARPLGLVRLAAARRPRLAARRVHLASGRGPHRRRCAESWVSIKARAD